MRYSLPHNLKITVFVTLILAFNVLVTLWHIIKSTRVSLNEVDPAVEYSYIGQDFPARHPLLSLYPASTTLQESVHYELNASSEVSSLEWDSLVDHPGGFGRAIIGPDRRMFLMTFYHQLHCIREIHRAITYPNDVSATPHHVNHCIQYLRQTLLCSATAEIEEGDFMEKNYPVDKVGSDLVCVDWANVYEELGRSWEDFKEWRRLWN